MRSLLIVLAATLFSPWVGAQSLVAAGSAPTAQHTPRFTTPILKRAQLDALLAHPERIVIIDLRRPDEIQSIGSLPVYLSIQPADLEHSFGYIPKDRTIVTVSNHATRAGTAGDQLTRAGFKVAGAVGVEFYEKEGGTLSKIVPPETKK